MTIYEHEDVVRLIAEGDQQYRSIGEWERLCRDSQAWADQARVKARRPLFRAPEVLIVFLATVWIAIVVFFALRFF